MSAFWPTTPEQIAVVEQVTNAALAEVGLGHFHMVIDDDGRGWFDGDEDPPDSADDLIDRALTLGWKAAASRDHASRDADAPPNPTVGPN